MNLSNDFFILPKEIVDRIITWWVLNPSNENKKLES